LQPSFESYRMVAVVFFAEVAASQFRHALDRKDTGGLNYA